MSTNPTESTVLPEIREEMTVEKKTVEAGGVRVVREVVHRVEEYDAELRQQHIHIVRLPIGCLLSTLEAPPPRIENGTTIISVVEEVLVVEKRLRLIEEVHITVDEQKRYQSGEVELREEKLNVERFDSDGR